MKDHGAGWLSAGSVVGWIASHVADINSWLQMLVLVIALISGGWSLWLRMKRRKHGDHR